MANHDIRKIKKEFNRSDEARYIHRLHGVFLVLKGLSSVKAAELLNEPQRTVAEWVKRFRTKGFQGVGITETRGRPNVLGKKEILALQKAVLNPPKESGLTGKRWTGALASKFLKQRFGIDMTPRNSRNVLHAMESDKKTSNA